MHLILFKSPIFSVFLLSRFVFYMVTERERVRGRRRESSTLDSSANKLWRQEERWWEGKLFYSFELDRQRPRYEVYEAYGSSVHVWALCQLIDGSANAA